jgi:hypothetical protein
MLGSWYATVLLWKPQVALLVNEKTLLPVLMPLAPAKDLLALSLRLSETPCSPLYKGAVSPDRELRRLVSIFHPRTAAND